MSRAQRTAPAAYTAILEMARSLSLPVSFETDITTHDRRAIEAKPGARFMWCVYEHGSHLMWVDDSPLAAQAERFGVLVTGLGRAHCFYWDGSALFNFRRGAFADDHAA